MAIWKEHPTEACCETPILAPVEWHMEHGTMLNKFAAAIEAE
jgi:hypothetical protein